MLAIGDYLLRKDQQDPALKLDYRSVFDPDRPPKKPAEVSDGHEIRFSVFAVFEH